MGWVDHRPATIKRLKEHSGRITYLTVELIERFLKVAEGELDPMQILKMHEMDLYPNTVDYSSRRTGKTAVKEMHNLEVLATNSHQECGIVAPRMQQAQNNLNYLIDAIKRSAMLTAFIYYSNGRSQLRDTGFEFVNRSKASAFGIMAQIDGESLTIGDLEEIDDMPQDRLLSRLLPMLGAARRLAVYRNTVNDLSASLDDLETRQAPDYRLVDVVPEMAVETIHRVIRSCPDPKQLRMLLGTFVQMISVSNASVIVEYREDALLRSATPTVHSGVSWLLDLGSNQGPTD